MTKCSRCFKSINLCECGFRKKAAEAAKKNIEATKKASKKKSK